MTGPEFTDAEWQGHINHVQAIARTLAISPTGGLAGVDELESQALVVLWDLARVWEPSRQENPGAGAFTRFLTMYAKCRLIDWLRDAYGRADGHVGKRAKLQGSFATCSLGDEWAEWEPRLTDAAPSAEETVFAPIDREEQAVDTREKLGDVFTFIRQRCSSNQQRALRASMRGESQAVADELGMKVSTFYTHASHARARLRAEGLAP